MPASYFGSFDWWFWLLSLSGIFAVLSVFHLLSSFFMCCSFLLTHSYTHTHTHTHTHSTSLLRSAWQKSRKNWNRTTLPSKQMQFQSWPMWVWTIFSWFSIPSFKSILGDGWFQHLALPWEPTSSGRFQVLPNAVMQLVKITVNKETQPADF